MNIWEIGGLVILATLIAYLLFGLIVAGVTAIVGCIIWAILLGFVSRLRTKINDLMIDLGQ